MPRSAATQASSTLASISRTWLSTGMIKVVLRDAMAKDLAIQEAREGTQV